MKKVELLSPVGNYETLLAAINAGADAVYLAGNQFGARAYADNFNNEELIDVIETAHLFKVKVYLTVNTLIKEFEMSSVLDFLNPLVSRGLDGVIVQDPGLVKLLNESFPNLRIHASTQMSVTGPYSIGILKKYNVNRVVLARELSLEEIKRIKEETGVEIETFIHGAMCYCYSGQCLFSSMLGERSGNRGRCAQPCRLEYGLINNKSCYPFSMKDMCTLSIIPELIEAGIDSFKIEGRMKKAEYCAGVTSIYRKYIDLYYSKSSFCVDKKDLDFLSDLYIRSDLSEGYYHRHNSKSMITVNSPAYNGADDSVINHIRDKYIKNRPTIKINAKAVFIKNKPFSIELEFEGIKCRCEGSVVETARSAPVLLEKLKAQICKTKDTFFEIVDLQVSFDDDAFLPIGVINSLRREAVEKLKAKILDNINVQC